MTAHSLILFRHAKAEPPRTGQSDTDRRLSDRGRSDATAAGAWLRANDLFPGLVLCSPARRTRETWAAAVAGAAAVDEAPVSYVPSLYSEGFDATIELLAGLPDEIGTVLVLGHNPTLSVVSAILDPAGNGSGLRTAGLAVHAVESWARCGRGLAPLVRAHTPRGTADSVGR